MSFDLQAVNAEVRTETVNQFVWPEIWKWLCRRAGNLAPEDFSTRGSFNDGLLVSAALAEYFAVILERDTEERLGPWTLYEYGRTRAEGTRAERLAKFFRASGGFKIW